jgi:hypothetical protein
MAMRVFGHYPRTGLITFMTDLNAFIVVVSFGLHNGNFTTTIEAVHPVNQVLWFLYSSCNKERILIVFLGKPHWVQFFPPSLLQPCTNWVQEFMAALFLRAAAAPWKVKNGIFYPIFMHLCRSSYTLTSWKWTLYAPKHNGQMACNITFCMYKKNQAKKGLDLL